MNYSPTLSVSKNGFFALKIYSRGWLGSLVNWFFQRGPIGWLAARKFVSWQATSYLLKPLTWSWVAGVCRFEMPVTPVDALHICWALDMDDKAIKFFWATQVSLMWEDAKDEGRDDTAMALKALLSSQGFDTEGERIHA